MNFIKKYFENRTKKKELLRHQNTWTMVACFNGLAQYWSSYRFRYSLILKENMLGSRECELVAPKSIGPIGSKLSFKKEQSSHYMINVLPWLNGVTFKDIPSYDEVILELKNPKLIHDDNVTDYIN